MTKPAEEPSHQPRGGELRAQAGGALDSTRHRAPRDRVVFPGEKPYSSIKVASKMLHYPAITG